jgi:WD40 repeat protein
MLMPKLTFVSFILSLVFIVGCQAAQPATATATPAAVVASTEKPTPDRVETAVPTATLPPFTQGRIVFFRDDRTEPGVDGPGGVEGTMGLYQAIPGTTPDKWTVEPLINESVFNGMYLSPDRTKLALIVLEDTDGDGLYSTWDDYKIHIYQFDDHSAGYSVLRIDNKKSLASKYSLSWLPDSQAVYYPQASNIELARLDGSSPEMLTDNPPDPIEDEPYNYIYQLVGSPDGTLVALDMDSGIGLSGPGWRSVSRDLVFFDTLQTQFVPIIENFPFTNAGYFNMDWSPDSQWLTFANNGPFGLSVLNAQTHTIQQLVEPADATLPIWSPDGQYLAFPVSGALYLWEASTQTVVEVTPKDTLLSKPVWSPDSQYLALATVDGALQLWDTTTQAVIELTRKDMLSGEPVWSPDGSLLAVSYTFDSEGGILFVDLITQVEQLLPLEIFTRQVIWSPDGEWLTGIFGGEDQVGLFVVNRQSGESHLILDLTGQNIPTTIMWLP